ncbi:MAG: hypothetical protein IPI20_09285 [Rhodoferax sp.]|nr:hypothetical protein [Rhodoferax sp.]
MPIAIPQFLPPSWQPRQTLKETTTSTRRQTLKTFGATGIAAALGFPLASQAQAPAVETVPRIVVEASPPGGTTDAVARRLAGKNCVRNYAVNALVENKPGAVGNRRDRGCGDTALLTARQCCSRPLRC